MTSIASVISAAPLDRSAADELHVAQKLAAGPTAHSIRAKPPHEQRLKGLDGLRAIAVAGVIAFHLHNLSGFPSQNFWRIIQVRGSFGVTVFFVLSGYLITHLLIREEDRTGRIDIKRFYLRRAFRILPAAIVFLVVIAGLAHVGLCHTSWRKLLASAFLCRNLITVEYGVTDHFWSLSVEEQFYLLWPVVMVWFGGRARLAGSIVLLVAFSAWRVYLGWVAVRAPVPLFRTDAVAFAPLAGCALAVLVDDPAGGRVLHGRWLTGWLALGAGMALIAASLSPARFHAGTPLSWSADVPGSVGVALVINVVTHGGVSPLNRVLDATPMVWLGKLSYSIYLWQQLLCYAPPRGAWVGRLPQCLAVTLAAAATSYYLIEQPALRLRNRLFAGRRDAGSAANVGGP